MKDRIPEYPGRIELVPVPEQPNIYDMTMADEPVEEGTPPIKMNLLTDDTAALYGGVETVNEALATDVRKVGDILTTKRTDLSSAWLYCNGAKINAASYPELLSMLPPGFTSAWSKYQTVSNGSLDGLTYNGTYYVTGGTDAGLLLYATNPAGPWTRNAQSTQRSFDSVAYGNGYWVAAGGYELMYGTDITKSLTKHPQFSEQIYSAGVNYGNGYWAVSSGAALYYATNPTASWTYANTPSSFSKLTFVNGYWIGLSGADIRYAATPKGGWSQSQVNTSSIPLMHIAYADGRWVSVGFSNNVVYVYSSTDISGPWTAASFSVPYQTQVRGIAGGGGYWIIGFYGPDVYYATNPAGPWNIGSTGVTNVTSLIYANGFFVSGDRGGAIWRADANQRVLPAISIGVPSYILGRRERSE